MTTRTYSIAAVLALCGAAAQAQVAYRFVFQQADFRVGTGQSVSLPVYLEETVTGTTPSLLLSENGLESVGVRLTTIAPLPSSPARFIGSGVVSPNTADFFPPGDPLFPPVISVSPTEVRLLEFARHAGVVGNPGTPGRRTVFFGNFVITAGSVPGEVTTIRAGDFGPLADTVTWNSLLVLDQPPYGIASTTATVTAIPNACYANCDGSTLAPILSISDLICFQQRFALGDVYCNCDGSTTPPTLNIGDFICFQARYAQGCQ
jgi:hypothetical protein